MGHGSGGVLTHKLLDKGVFSLLSNDLLDQKHDGAVFQIDGPMAFSTDSYVVNPIFFPGGNIGDLAVNGTVNDLATHSSCCGARQTLKQKPGRSPMKPQRGTRSWTATVFLVPNCFLNCQGCAVNRLTI